MTKIQNHIYIEYLISTYQRLIYSICLKTTQDAFEAEDLAQETFISAYKNLDTFDKTYEKAWLCKIATNKCLDYLKSSKRRVITTPDEFFNKNAALEPSPEELFLSKVSQNDIFKLCNNLSPPYNEISIEYFLNGLSLTEISIKYNRPYKTTQTQFYRARSQLQKIYKEVNT